MPIYEYRCAECGHELEKLQKINDAPLVDCPACGKPALHKLVSAAGFRLKGGGWYETDFKSGKKKNIAKGESGKAGKTSGDDAKSSSGSEKKTG
jgi:putative FmdB family regulatory protein